MPTPKPAPVRAGKDEKMIEVKVRFWTDDIAPSSGEVIQKHASIGGVVRMERNPTHGISPKKPRVFNSLMDLPAVMERVLVDHGIVLQTSDRMRKYVRDR